MANPRKIDSKIYESNYGDLVCREHYDVHGIIRRLTYCKNLHISTFTEMLMVINGSNMNNTYMMFGSATFGKYQWDSKIGI